MLAEGILSAYNMVNLFGGRGAPLDSLAGGELPKNPTPAHGPSGFDSRPQVKILHTPLEVIHLWIRI